MNINKSLLYFIILFCISNIVFADTYFENEKFQQNSKIQIGEIESATKGVVIIQSAGTENSIIIRDPEPKTAIYCNDMILTDGNYYDFGNISSNAKSKLLKEISFSIKQIKTKKIYSFKYPRNLALQLL